mmetsp:Transcript_53026/g.133332  ORF Transcript_53026/g.133332 Transcript_53026/m.133332 type:complete len:699 (-) Transcript_53026:33-2129(-)|eukprot:CAMPEP_0177657200 /NCGR_PEP_ID=MMETSP0447-20121125/16042_1 /TAXON_ID=0 /ORGANISM="Stygamoeba regulata, Strain BSH-02190019" /LENGTH=698 /DNA_ID=CAMNT_0019161507 /DNA_START=60 /DNA_END=2156 /DNA_ORIENTATION=-
MGTQGKAFLLLSLYFLSPVLAFQVGAGIWDVTGPAAEVGMMGYASPNMKAYGIHTRLRARAFVVKGASATVAFVSSDTCMIFNGVKDAVVKQLEAELPGVFTHDNVMLSGIHTHSGPAGFSYRPIYNLVSLGFHKDNFDVIVLGISKAIVNAYKNLADAKILVNNGTLSDSNINRSAAAYESNPAEERAKYATNTDHDMVLLRFDKASGGEIGLLNWFAVHGTSMTMTNSYISGDNKGTASLLVEKAKNGPNRTGRGPFVAAFGQTNEGDVSPRTRGAFCPDGSPCDHVKATCGGKSQGCNGIGPGKDEFESTQIIGKNQADMALKLFDTATVPVEGDVGFIHMYVDMENVTVSSEFTSTGKVETTCIGALGDGFAGGTTDGPGDFDFTQGTNSTSTNPVWNFLAHFLKEPTKAQEQCHHPKPILFLSGGINIPTHWTPSIIPLQMFRIGDLWIIGAPGEFTTMSGRRLRDTVRAALESAGALNEKTVVVIAGLSNEYTHYITTYEEYQIQRYEGGSTLFGPHTLAAYQQEFAALATALATGKSVQGHAAPEDISSKVFNFQTPVVLDTAPGKFGDVESGPKKGQVFQKGALVTAVFWGANPRNDFLNQKSFCDVEVLQGGKWEVFLDDGAWETKFHWARSGLAHSKCTCSWQTDADTPAGTYRIHHYGVSRSLLGSHHPYDGATDAFVVQGSSILTL